MPELPEIIIFARQMKKELVGKTIRAIEVLQSKSLNPLRTIDALSDAEIEALAQAIHDGLQPSIDKGGSFYELDLYGQKGGFEMDDILIGYKEGQPCPECGTPIEKIKTGSTSSFICPRCQPLGG